MVGVNIADMSLQFVLLWKAYLGNNRSKLILVVGSIPILSIAVFIWVNMTIGKSKTFLGVGLCATEYRKYYLTSLVNYIYSDFLIKHCILLLQKLLLIVQQIHFCLDALYLLFTDIIVFLEAVFKKH